MREKLEEILKILEEKHLDFFILHSKEELNAYKELLIDEVGLNRKEDIFYISKLIIKYMLGGLDTHTTVYYGDAKPAGLTVRVINDEVYVIRTSEEFKDYNYMKLIGINNIDINTIKEEVAKISNYSDKERFEEQFEFYINRSYLDRLPMFRDCDTLVFNFENDINLNYDTTKEYTDNYKAGDNFSYRIIDNSLIFQYISCQEPRPGFMKETVEKLKNEINNHKEIENFVVDLRYNGGGNSAIIDPLLEYLEESNLNIITFTNKYVYSSGSLDANILKRMGSVIIGTGIGTGVNNFGDIIFINDEIDGLKYGITISTKYFYFGENNEINAALTKDELHKLSEDKFKPAVFEPDVYIYETIEDIKEHRDVYLEALEEAKSDILINLFVDKEPYIKEITDDNIINLTGQSGSGKSTYAKNNFNSDEYLVIDTDDIFSESNYANATGINKELGTYFREKYEVLPNCGDNFDLIYNDILEYCKKYDKTIVIDCAQFHCIKDIGLLKGKLIVLRTCIKNCYNRAIERYKKINPNYTEEALNKYKEKKKSLFKWYKYSNNFISSIDLLNDKKVIK